MTAITLRHVEHFTNVIGPRGSTTEQERQAHAYCQATLEGLGYTVQRDTFDAPTSGWHPYALALGLMLVADLLFVLAGAGPNAQMGGLAAGALGLITLISFYLQLRHRPNPLQWLLPVAPSQNVWAVAEPRADVWQKVVVVGHVNSHRAALAMRSPALWRVFQILTFAVSLALAVLVLFFLWGIFTPDPLLRTVALYLGLLPILGLVFTLQPDFQPYVKGANYNATGAGAVLALAERLQGEPLERSQVFLVNTGGEDAGGAGMADWIRRHAPAEAAGANYLVLNAIGGKGASVRYVVDETVLQPIPADPGLIRLAETAAQEQPELGAQPVHYRGLFSELSVCTVHRQKALAVMTFDPRTGTPPNFDTPRDDLDNVDPEVLDRSEQFAWAILKKLDRA